MSSGMSLNGREIFESDWLGSIDLGGKDLTLKIVLVEKAEVFNPATNKKSFKLAFRFDGQQKGMIVNRTNATTISKLYGTEAEKWAGKSITLYPTTCKVGRETTTCLRVREKVPGVAKQEPSNELTLVQKYAARLAELKPEEIQPAYQKFDAVAPTMDDATAQKIYQLFAKYVKSEEPVI